MISTIECAGVTGENLNDYRHIFFQEFQPTVYLRRRAAEIPDRLAGSESSCSTPVQFEDFIVIDTPGSDTGLSRIGHARADILITPLNDSFLDLDLLARLDREGKQIKGPSIYAEAVWEQRKRRALADLGTGTQRCRLPGRPQCGLR